MQACVHYRPTSLSLYITTYFPPSLSPSLFQTHEIRGEGGVDAREREVERERARGEREREREREKSGSGKMSVLGERKKVMRQRHPVYSLACTAYNLLFAAFPV
jgi:hypothetical protein